MRLVDILEKQKDGQYDMRWRAWGDKDSLPLVLLFGESCVLT
jgi:hypothetical protein